MIHIFNFTHTHLITPTAAPQQLKIDLTVPRRKRRREQNRRVRFVLFPELLVLPHIWSLRFSNSIKLVKTRNTQHTVLESKEKREINS